MLSYKSMCMIIADQAKNLKLMHERRKDEHDNLMNALREMQADGASQERLGKLYFIIMLSRWQEAAVNKKYEGTLSEVNYLRTELLNSNMLLEAKEREHQGGETTIMKISVEISKLRNALSSAMGNALTQAQADEMNKAVQDMLDSKTELQDSYIGLYSKHRLIKDTCDLAKAK